MRENKGDVHNFGRRVEHFENEGCHYFRKPRPISSELFLLGKASPLRALILSKATGSRSARAWDNIFSLVGNIENNKNDWCEYCGIIESLPKIDINEIDRLRALGDEYLHNFAYDFGIIAAYSVIFGLRDLHYENYIISEKGIHLIDAEVAFEGLKYLSQTVVIGTSPISKSFSGFAYFGHITNKYLDPNNLKESDFYFSQDLLEIIITGMLDAFDLINALKDEIVQLVANFFEVNKHMPIRVILRNTNEYFTYLQTGEVPKIPFIDEEIIQLKRSDIPYFFSTYQDRAIFYNLDSSGTREEVKFPSLHPFWTSLVLTFRYNTDRLFCAKRMDDLRAASCIELLREYCEPKQVKIKIGSTELNLIDDKILYEWYGQKYEGKTCRSFLEENTALNFFIKIVDEKNE